MLALTAAVLALSATLDAHADPCAAPVANPIACENSQPGNSSSEWQVFGIGDPSIQGFATDISVNRGQTVRFKIDTDATAYRIDIYRMGYYGGLGARKVATVLPSVPLPQQQPACLNDASTGLVDCGNWAQSASWAVPASATSGIYFARLVRTDTGGASHIVFVVRDDASQAAILFQTSDTTWQAYNEYGGNSLYVGAPAGRAYKVSYNRPFITSQAFGGKGALSWVFGSEYPMVRWLEANGYNVTYTSGVDSDRRGGLLLQHKVFMSVGHDEYWSAAQRANVEAARNAGVNLAFFSGNEVFWKTRWEPSIDGSNTPYRTLVSYKETHANAKIDPDQAWTGSWRDSRFSPPADGGRPENALTGTSFTVNCCRDDALTVSAEQGRLWFWRNTGLEALTTGQVASIPGMLGYEWDEDLDNGARPAGLMRLSSTTVNVDSHLQDFGSTYAPGTATHSLTLYRHSSGALVFGAGTIQWPWGLDADHDDPLGTTAVPDARIQQATVNLLADMGMQPATLQAGLAAAVASTDLTPPSSTITAPAANSSVQSSVAITITGTASDLDGRVAAVEVSVNGGLTWYPATGRASWSYIWTPGVPGVTTIQSRAVDDSGNIQSPATSRSVNVAPRPCPCNLWPASATPAIAADPDGQAIEVGVKLTSDEDGRITALRFYKGASNTGVHTVNLWAHDGTLLASATSVNETASGWQQVALPAPVIIHANTTYVASYHTTSGRFSVTSQYFNSPHQNAPLRAPASATVGGNGVYKYGASGFPTQTFNSGNYWVDVVFDRATPDNVAAIVSTQSPAPGAVKVALSTKVTATFSEAINPASLTFQLRNPGNAVVPATVGYDAATRTATLTPNAPLAESTTYTATVSGATDAAGNIMAPTSWAFTSFGPATSIWSNNPTPANVDSGDPNAVEVGVKFRSDIAGYITGIRFYKSAANTGTHTANLWTSTGALLATTTFSNETGSGWQQVIFPAPVAISANTTYVASYHAPNGRYSVNYNFFGAAGVDDFPLHALASGVDGPNGVYAYSSTSTFPGQSYNHSNYWVDVVFSQTFSDPVPPTVVSRSPVAGSTSAPPNAPVTAQFSEPVTAASISFELRTATNTLVPSSMSYDAVTRTAKLTPAATLAFGTTYTATVSGATDATGNAMTGPVSWSFSTPTCPCTIWNSTDVPAVADSGDSGAVEVGVKFRSEIAGYISGIRFYKSAANTGTHTANLWSSTGTLLASATFTNETASGWQQVFFPAPVAINANTTYVASYHAPNGRYARGSSFFTTGGVDRYPLRALASGVDGPNGVYAYGAAGTFPNQSYNDANYWVDALFSPILFDPAAPTVIAQTPAPGSNRVSSAANVTAKFSEPVAASSIVFELRTSANSLVPASVSYDAATRTATLTPSSPLTYSATYTALLSGATDSVGNSMAPVSWSFSTPTCPCTIWNGTDVPTMIDSGDSAAVEVGVKFRSEVTGYISGIRFYKNAANTGTHTANLWTGTGTLLASTTFTNETASGWQQVNLPTPIPVAANTTYVASYHAPFGRYSSTGGAFGATGMDSAPLKALANGVDGPNGVFSYGPGGVYPIQSFNATNYWVDVVFTTSVSADSTPPTVVAVSPTNGATGVDAAANVTVTFSENMDPATITIATIELRDAANAIVSAEVTYDAPRRVATLNPNLSLRPTATYTVRILGGSTGPRAKDLAGNALAATSTSSFTTAVDTTPPTVSAVVPASGATGVSLTTSVEVQFSEDMAPSSVNGTTVELRGPTGLTVSAAVTYDAARQTAVLAPTMPLSDVTTYTVTVRGGSTDPRVKDSAGHALATTFTSTFTTSAIPPAIAGQWQGPINWPLVAVHAVLLKSGEVLLWDGPNEGDVPGTVQSGGEEARLWNPVTGTFTRVTLLTNIFCAGHATLADGRALVAGGHAAGGVGIPDVSVFDPVARQWATASPMAYARWYPSTTILSDGRALVLSGSTTCQACIAEVPEVYDPFFNTWKSLPRASAPIPLYPYTFVLPDGRLIAAGAYDEPRFVTRTLDLVTQTWSVVDPRPLDGGSAVMYLPGKILKSGTARQVGGIMASAEAWVIDMNDPSPAWGPTAPMGYPRVYHTLTLLPDGSVLATGGGRDTDSSNLAAAVFEAEIWSPTTETWTTMARMQTPRLYHSTALLLPDGRVLVAGSGRTEGVDQLSAEIFSPPYLFKGARPTITSAPTSAQYGSRIVVGTPDGATIATVSLIRAGSVTHAFDYDQRIVPLTFRRVADGLEVDVPADANLAPPGNYMLFLVDTNGVPSVAPFVTVTTGATFRDTGIADFSAGAPDANIHVGQSEPELILRPSQVSEFAGSTLPAGWSSTAWQAGGNATVAGGMLRVDGARAGTDVLRGFGTLEFVATFGTDAYQHVGLGLTLNEAPYAIFSTGGGNALYTRIHDGTTAIDTLIPGAWLGVPHRYRIEWTPTAVNFLIDGFQVASYAMAIATDMRPLASDFFAGLGTPAVDWLRMSPYAASGTFLSRVFDAGGEANWGPLWWNGYAPAGTTLTLSARTGNTPIPDGTWLPFTTVPTSGAPIGGSSRYIQYRAILTATNPSDTPALRGVTIGYQVP